jgi:DNA ligase (NAD+)
VRRLDSRVTASRRLVFFASGCDRLPPPIEAEWQLLGALKSWGFAVMPVTWRCAGINEVLDFISALHQIAPAFEFPLEGGTLRVNKLSFQSRARFSQEGAMDAVALAFPMPGRLAVVSNVYFAVGRAGAVLPVALMEKAPGQDLPVPERAPIPAESVDAMLPLRKGSSIRVRPGSVAPVISVDRWDGGHLSIEACPICSGLLRRAPDEPFAHCENLACRGRARARLLHLIGPRGLRLESINVKTIDKLLIDPGLLDAADLMTLAPDAVERAAPGRGEIFRSEIERARRVPLWRLLYLLAIPHVSEHSARAIAHHVFDVPHLEKLSEEECLAIPNVSLEALIGLARWLSSEGPRMLRRLKQGGVEVLDGAQSFPAPFFNRLVCVAGDLEVLGNVHAMDEIERRGGILVHRVSRATDYLVVGKNAQKATESAKQYGIPVIEEPAIASILRST